MANVDLSLINQALTRTRSDPIASLDDQSAGGKIANLNYEDLVKAELGNIPWKFATKFEELTQLDEDVHGEPPEPWEYSYQRPNDIVEIRTIKQGGAPIAYELAGSKIFTNYDNSTDALVAHCLWRPAESLWPSWFRAAMIARLEAMFLRGVAFKYEEADARDKRADGLFRIAATRDAQSQTPRQPFTSPTLEARRA